MTREDFLDFLTRCVLDRFATEQEAVSLLLRFDRGEVDTAALPLLPAEAIPTAEEIEAEIAARFAARTREPSPDPAQDAFELACAAAAARLGETGSVREWHRAMVALVTGHTVGQGVSGALSAGRG